MCTYLGQEYLAEQLESFAAQTYHNWTLWASDDGSQDATLGILEGYIAKWGTDKARLQSGPGKGFVANFLSITCDPRINADYYAYSDQDDIWEANKLERALGWLRTVLSDVPAVYCSRTLLVDCDNQTIGSSPLFRKPPSFPHALMQNIGGGNTMVFNNAARELLKLAGSDLELITHDWWAYLVVMACGGLVHYDPVPTVRYRQHGNNLVGSNVRIGARIFRIKMLWDGRFKDLNDQHIRALTRIFDRITPENKRILASFQQARTRSFISRLLGIARLRLYRQTILGNLGLIAATIFNKI